jgi:hypothetical protein
LSEVEIEDFELHFFACKQCTEDLRIAEIFEHNARAVFADGYTPPPWWRPLTTVFKNPSFAAPAFASLLLASVVGYQNFVTIPALLAPQAAFPISVNVKKDAGPAAAIKVPKGYSRVDLPIDLTEPRPAQIDYEFRNESSGRVIKGARATVPESGTIHISVSCDIVGPGENWSLDLRDARTGVAMPRYHFNYQRE